MVVYITLTVLVVLLASLVRNRDYVQLHIDVSKRENRINDRLDRGKAWNICAAVAIFVLLAGVSACRIAVGNDYWGYREQFKLIMQDRHVSYEWGFNYVVWIIQSLFGYDNYLPVFGFFSIITAFFFVKAVYDQGEWFGMSVFLLMTNGYYFSSLNSVRYYFALAVAMYSMKYVLRKQYGVFIAWVVFAALFHKTILVVIPVYLIAEWLSEHKLNKWVYAGLGAFLASLVIFRNVYRKIIFIFYPYYEGTAFDKVNFSVMNIAKCVAVLVLCILFYKTAVKENKQNRFYFFLTLAGLGVYTFGAFIPEVTRIGYYMTVSQIFLIPGVLLRIENRRWRTFWGVAVTVAFIGYFGMFLYTAQDMNIRLVPYLNWIFN